MSIAMTWRQPFLRFAPEVAAAKSGNLRLALGTIERADETYLNGVPLGRTGVFGRSNECAQSSKSARERACGGEFRRVLALLRNRSWPNQ